MFASTIPFFSLYLISYLTVTRQDEQCKMTISRYTNECEFNCVDLVSLAANLEKAPSNTTTITIVNSQIKAVPRFTFRRFGAALKSLDLHTCGIAAIDGDGFTDLVQLQKLVLWENNLTWISSDWFKNLANLRYLDVSFNHIFGLDNVFYQMLPNLENFYFDYNQLKTLDFNMFPHLSHLKKVKFGKNPWIWGYRTLLTWQLDNQRIDYQDDWEEWEWMSSIVRKCHDNGHKTDLSDTLLGCVIQNFLHMEIEHDTILTLFEMQQAAISLVCLNEATVFINCHNQSSSGQEVMRKIFESLAATLKSMHHSKALFY